METWPAGSRGNVSTITKGNSFGQKLAALTDAFRFLYNALYECLEVDKRDHLLVDLTQEVPIQLRLRSGFLRPEEQPVFYSAGRRFGASSVT